MRVPQQRNKEYRTLNYANDIQCFQDPLTLVASQLASRTFYFSGYTFNRRSV